MTPKFNLNQTLKVIDGIGYEYIAFVVLEVRYSKQTKSFCYYGVGGTRYYEDELARQY